MMEQELKMRGAPAGEKPKSPIHRAVEKHTAKDTKEPAHAEPKEHHAEPAEHDAHELDSEHEPHEDHHEEKEHRVAVITGASSGIGKAVALHLASSNYDVVLIARKKDKLHEVEQELAKYRVKVLVRECDVTKVVQVHDAIQHAAKQFGRIDVLVNCAGYGVHGDLETMRLEDINGQMLTNYFGTVLVIKEALPKLREHRGAIVNISSMAGLIGIPKMAAYSASKHAIIGLSESLRYELETDRVSVSVVCPGNVRTNFFDHESFKDVGAPGDGIASSEVAAVVDRAIHERKFLYTVPSRHRLQALIGRLLPESWSKRRIRSGLRG
jgi:uncharacterized protein